MSATATTEARHRNRRAALPAKTTRRWGEWLLNALLAATLLAPLTGSLYRLIH